ncbi:MAG: 3'(2'),5'-bisphosphate nucleotidase CysQ [Pseudomonadota bacterium]
MTVALRPADAAADLDLIRSAASRAGEIAHAMQSEDVESWAKGDGSPVSRADMAADRFLRETLTRARPDYGWLSEETADAPDRLQARRTFVVDPIDGTRGYLAGGDDWCVCIGIVEAGRPVLAAIDAPGRGERFFAALGRGAFLNDAPLRITPRAELAGARLAGTRRAVERLGDLGATIVDYVPSLALRLAFVASGRLDAAIAHGGAKDWDLAAAELIVAEAGGRVTDAHGAGLAYNRADVRHPPVIAAGVDAGGMDLHAPLREKLRALLS